MSALQAIVEFTPITVSSADGTKDFVGIQTDAKDQQRAVRRASPWGISGRPVAGAGVLAAVVKAVGGAFGGMIVGVGTDKYGPQDLNSGETCIWNKVTGTRILLDQDGKISIDAGSGQDIVLNGGSLKVARKTDKTIGDTTMLAWITAVTAKFNAAAGPMLSAPASITPPTDFGVINDGAPHVLG